jgi:hypothetical protein
VDATDYILHDNVSWHSRSRASTLLSLVVAGQPGQAARQTSWRARCVAALSRDTARGPDQLTEYP